MAIVVRIPAAGTNRNQVKSLLGMSNRGRKGQVILTNESDGCYFAAIENEETALVFQVALGALGINSSELGYAEATKLIASLRIRTTAPTATTGRPGVRLITLANGDTQRAWTGDSRLDAAISKWLIDDLIGQGRRGLFGGRLFS